MTFRHTLTTAQRAALYAAEIEKARLADRGNLPICNICDQQIFPPSKWHDSHNPYLPLALGGGRDGIAHDRCNIKHCWRHDIPLIAKNQRIKNKFLDIHRTRQPLPGGRDDDRYRGVDGVVRLRSTGERS